MANTTIVTTKHDIAKIIHAANEMKSKVTLDNRHCYRRVSDNEKLLGVSSITKDAVAKPWLGPWCAKQAVTFLGYTELESNAKTIEMRDKIISGTIEDYLLILHNAKGAASRRSKTAQAEGTDCHGWLESYVKAKIAGEDTPVIPDELKRPIALFLEWAEANIDRWVLSEACVYNEEYGYAGTLDAAAILKDGRLVLIDFKLAVRIYTEYFLQTVGYVMPFEKYGIKFDDRIIIRLPKTEMINDEPDNIEVKVVETDYEVDRTAFLAAYTLMKWVKNLPKEDKEEKE